MRVLHIVGGRLGAGAARGAHWLHLGLKEYGVESVILTNGGDETSDPDVIDVRKYESSGIKNGVRRLFESVMPTALFKRRGMTFSTGFVGFDFTKSNEYRLADILHLHWVNDGLLSLKHLKKVEKPIVWTLRDMWPMTGGCHYSMGCENFIKNCGHCPQLRIRFKHDLSWLIFQNKRRSIPASLKVVGISNWLSEQARASALLKDHDVRTISNGIDLKQFFPVEKGQARTLLGIDVPKKIIAVGAQTLTDRYKGFDKFADAVNHLDRNKYHVVFFGNASPAIVSRLGLSYNAMGFLHDTAALRLVYSAADVFVAPSLMDAFGKTLAEAIACGTPVVCFDATGPKDIIDHGVNGYRAVPYDSRDLANGIDWVCHHAAPNELRRAAREKAERSFNAHVVAMEYIKLYREILHI